MSISVRLSYPLSFFLFSVIIAMIMEKVLFQCKGGSLNTVQSVNCLI